MMLWAVLQLAVPPLAVAADAAATAESRGAHAHVEATSDASCSRVHDAECVFCQFLSAGAAAGSATVAGADPVVGEPAIALDFVAPEPGATRGALLPRAPPIA